ncbi:hypothetical protein HK096_000898, partial [Nowakowskiella sp. JEL0078]
MSEVLDVLIVGAGPVGLLAAVELTRRFHSLRIIEKQRHQSLYSKAFIVHCRTLELLAHSGLDQEFMAQGVLYPELRILTALSNGEIRDFATLRLNDQDIGSEYEFAILICLPQNKIEAILRKYLNSMGHKVEHSAEFQSARIEGSGENAVVVSTVVSTDTHGIQTVELIRSKYLIGSDGVHSTVRKSQEGWTFEGVCIDGTFAIADGIFESKLSNWNLGLIFH